MARPAKHQPQGKKSKNRPEPWWMNIQWVSSLLAGLAFLLYINSLSNGFVLDDSLVITKNSFTTQGLGGLGGIFSHDTFQGYYGTEATEINIIGGRYRPLSLMCFAFLYQVFGASSFAFHFWNVLTFSICCAFLYRVLRKTFEPVMGLNGTAIFSALAALLFTVHPIHTEVVNNIKSNDEIMCLLLSLASLHLAVRYWDTQKKILAFLSGVSLFLACLAKENAVVFLGIIPLTLFLRQQFVNKKKVVAAMPLALSLGILFVIYFMIRYSVLGWSMGESPLDLINNPFIKFNGEAWVHCSMHEKLAMIFWSLGKYLQLFLFPYSLSTDYYPRFVDVITLSNPMAILSLIVYLGLGIFVIYKIWKKQLNIVVYGIAFFLMALSIVSNVVFPIGTNLAERFLFTPSVGLCIVVAGLIYPHVINRENNISKTILPVIVIVMLVLSARTFIRNFDFESNKVLLSEDVKVSGKSAKIQNAYGSVIAEEALKSQDPAEKTSLSQTAMEHLNKAIAIHPTYLEAFYMRGNVYFMMGKYEDAIQDFRTCLRLNENFKSAYSNYTLALREAARSIISNKGDINTAIKYLEEAHKLFPDEPETNSLLEKAKGQLIPVN